MCLDIIVNWIFGVVIIFSIHTGQGKPETFAPQWYNMGRRRRA